MGCPRHQRSARDPLCGGSAQHRTRSRDQILSVPGAAHDYAGGSAAGSRLYAHGVLALLVLAYGFNILDRTMIAIVGQAIKVDMKLSDAELGLLGGFAFAILYSTLGLPIARLAERWNRVSIIAIAMVIWSGFTAACGAASGFVQLLMMRIGVGMGEAGLSPPAFSLISDYYPPQRRASALSIYTLGGAIGTMIGGALGGWLAKTFGWRAAFFFIGAPGIVLAIVIKLLIREPARGALDLSTSIQPESAARPFDLGEELSELGQTCREMLRDRVVLHMVLGLTLSSVATYSLLQFVPAYFIRAFDLDYATVGVIFGLTNGLSAAVGVVLGGFVTDWLGQHDARWRALVPAIGLIIAAPIYWIVFTRPDWRIAAAILFAPGIFQFLSHGPTFGAVQNAFPPHRRATATALMLLFLTLVAAGGGPPLIGWIIDRFAEAHFAAMPGIHDHFSAMCVTGKAPPAAGSALAASCQDALARATRGGLFVSIAFLVWGGLHFAIAGLRRPAL
ncbi:MAG: MFS transporter [Sphingomonas bacterium]